MRPNPTKPTLRDPHSVYSPDCSLARPSPPAQIPALAITSLSGLVGSPVESGMGRPCSFRQNSYVGEVIIQLIELW